MQNIIKALIVLTIILSLNSCDYFCDCDCEDDNPIDTEENLSLEGLFVYYNFDSNSIDQSENNLDCQPVGNYSYVSGIKGNAIFLDNPPNQPFAHNAYVNLPEFNYSNDYTVSFHIKYNYSSAASTNHATYIWTAGAQVQSGNNNGYEYQLGFRTNAHTHEDLVLFGGNSEDVGFITDTEKRPSIKDAQWHHVLLRKSDNTIEFYFDNTLIEKVSIPSDLSFENYYESFLGKHQWIQGGSMNKADRYNGYIDEFFLFERAIIDDEIHDLFNLNY